jgi:hypothetical protein
VTTKALDITWTGGTLTRLTVHVPAGAQFRADAPRPAQFFGMEIHNSGSVIWKTPVTIDEVHVLNDATGTFDIESTSDTFFNGFLNDGRIIKGVSGTTAGTFD